MPTSTVTALGSIGYVPDRPPQTVPSNGWTEMSNIRCIDGSIASFPGHQQVTATQTTPEAATVVYQGGYYFLAYVGGTEVYAYDGTSHLHFTGPVLSANGDWDIIQFGGVGIVNNGVNAPVYGSAPLVLTTLPYSTVDDADCSWEDVGMRAKFIRAFKRHLFAFDITDCSGHNRHRIHWSHPAVSDTVPVTWDPTLPAYDAGFKDCGDTPGEILDALPLKDSLVVYKEDSIYAMYYTGRADNEIFNLRLMADNIGVYARNCVCDIGGVHFLITDSDIGLFDGNRFKSVSDGRVKDAFFSEISYSQRDKVFVVFNERQSEVWCCVPEADQDACTKAYVYNLTDDTWYMRSLPSVLTAVNLRITHPSGYVCSDFPSPETCATWAADPPVEGWVKCSDLTEGNTVSESLVMGSTDGYFYEMDVGNTANGTNLTCYARNSYIEIGERMDQNMITRVIPLAYGDPFNVRVGYRIANTGTVSWTAYQEFDPSTDYKLDFRVTGFPHAIEFQSAADVAWKVSDYEVEYKRVGSR